MYVLSAYVDLEKIGMFELVRGELWKASDIFFAWASNGLPYSINEE